MRTEYARWWFGCGCPCACGGELGLDPEGLIVLLSKTGLEVYIPPPTNGYVELPGLLPLLLGPLESWGVGRLCKLRSLAWAWAARESWPGYVRTWGIGSNEPEPCFREVGKKAPRVGGLLTMLERLERWRLGSSIGLIHMSAGGSEMGDGALDGLVECRLRVRSGPRNGLVLGVNVNSVALMPVGGENSAGPGYVARCCGCCAAL